MIVTVNPVINELYDMGLVEKGRHVGEHASEPELAYPTDRAASAEDLRLVRLSNVERRRSKCPDPGSEIEFCDNLTILYGENGTAKTGYARVLKRLAALRDAEEIVPARSAAGETVLAGPGTAAQTSASMRGATLDECIHSPQ